MLDFNKNVSGDEFVNNSIIYDVYNSATRQQQAILLPRPNAEPHKTCDY
jgi:hypothetical protein